MNPVAGCRYFPPGLQLPLQPLTGLLPILLLGEHQGTMGVNSLPKTVIPQRRGCDLNPGCPRLTLMSTVLIIIIDYQSVGRSICSCRVPIKSLSIIDSDQLSVPHCWRCRRSSDVTMATVAKATNELICRVA